MKKLNKTQKENIKKSIFKVFHVIGYFSTALLIVLAIAVGVNSCKPKSQVQNYDQVSLVDNKIKRSVDYNDLSYSTLLNCDGNVLTISSNSVFVTSIFSGSAMTSDNISTIQAYALNSGGNYVTANTGVYRYEFDENNEYTEFAYFVISKFRINSNKLEGYDSGGVWRTLSSSNGRFAIVFEDTRYFLNPYQDAIAFNGYLIQIDSVYTSQDYGNDYIDYFDVARINTYEGFIQQNWIKPNQYWLAPYVLPIKDLTSNVPNPNYIPVFISMGGDKYEFLNYDYRDYISIYSAYSEDKFEFFNFLYTLEGTSVNPSQTLGYCLSSLSNDAYQFFNYCGFYKFHNIYKNFYAYCFLVGSTLSHSAYINTNVNTDLSFEVNAFEYYRLLGGGSGTDVIILGDGIYYVNASTFNQVSVGYGIQSPTTSWFVSYTKTSTGYVYRYLDSNDPLIKCTIYNVNHYSLMSLLYNGYQPNKFTRLNSYYDSTFVYTEQILPPNNDNNSNGLGSLFGMFASCFDAVANILNVNLFGAFTIGGLLFLPLIVMIVLFIVNLFKR